MEIKFDVYFKKNLGTLFKSNEVDLDGIPAHTNLDLNLVDRLEANYKVGTQKYTDSVGIVDIEERVIQIPFKSDVVKVGLNEFEIVAYMLNGDIKTSQTYTYNIDEAIGEGVVSGGSGDGHSHTNLAILNSITQSKINEWNNKAERNHNHSEYASENHTHNVNEIEGLENIDIDLSNYYTKSETDEVVNSKADKVHTHSQYLTEHQDISHKADKENTYTKSQTDNKIVEEIAKAQIGGSGEVDLSAYATKNYVDDEISKIEIGDNIENFKFESIGELVSPNSNYVAWNTTLKYDKNINKFVCIINSADAHIFTTIEHHLIFIDPETFNISNTKKIEDFKFNVAICNFEILDNGNYMFICHTGTKVGGGNNHLYVSSNQGDTWTDKGEVKGIVDGKNFHLWNMKKLSNGRLIAGIDVAKKGIVYSDDNGMNWTNVIPVTCGGDYEAEACVIELEDNKLIAISRYSMSGNGYYQSGDSEGAIISYSNDNGNTWSAWEKSKSILNMNASSCDGFYKDGTVQIFATSRWYKNGSNENSDYTKTGKSGAMFYYKGSLKDALEDNFKNQGIIKYSNGIDGANAGEFHAPSVAIDNQDRLLIMHMNKGILTTCNSNFIRAEKGGLSYLTKENQISTAKSYSSYYVNLLINGLNEKIATLEYALSQIEGSGVKPPTGVALWTKKYNASEEQKHINESEDFSGDFIASSYQTLQILETDENGEQFSQFYQAGVFVEVTKKNCSVYVDIDNVKDKLNGSLGAMVAILKDGKLNGAIFENFAQVALDGRHNYKLEFKDNEFNLYFDDNKNQQYLSKDITDFEATKHKVPVDLLKTHFGLSEVPSTGTYIIVYPRQRYCAVYDLKVGEWD